MFGNAAQISGLVAVPFSGWLTDRYGVGWLTLVGAALFTLIGFPLYVLLSYNPDNEVIAYLIIGGVFGFLQGFAGATTYLFSAELFPARLRVTGIAMSYNLAVSYIGGFGSSICQALFRVSPHFAPGIYFSACGLVSVASVLIGRALERRGLVRLTHRRAEPYLGKSSGPGGAPVAARESCERGIAATVQEAAAPVVAPVAAAAEGIACSPCPAAFGRPSAHEQTSNEPVLVTV